MTDKVLLFISLSVVYFSFSFIFLCMYVEHGYKKFGHIGVMFVIKNMFCILLFKNCHQSMSTALYHDLYVASDAE